MLKLADTSLILIKPSPSNVKSLDLIKNDSYLLGYFQLDDPFDYHSVDCKFHLLSNKRFHRSRVLLCLQLFEPLDIHLWSVFNIFHNVVSLHLSLPWRKTYLLQNECKCKWKNPLSWFDLIHIIFVLIKIDAWTSLGFNASHSHIPLDFFNTICKPWRTCEKWVYWKLHAPLLQVSNEILIEKGIFQTFWKDDCCPILLFFDFEISNFATLIPHNSYNIMYLKYGFCNKSFRKDEPLNSWTFFQHICPHFWEGLLGAIANPPKREDKYVEKVFNWSEVHLSELTF